MAALLLPQPLVLLQDKHVPVMKRSTQVKVDPSAGLKLPSHHCHDCHYSLSCPRYWFSQVFCVLLAAGDSAGQPTIIIRAAQINLKM